MLICRHITPDSDAHVVWFTGRGIDHFLVCPTCAVKFPDPPPDLIEASPELLDSIGYVFCCEGVCGAPEVLSRDTTLRFLHQEFASPLPADLRMLDIVPDRNSKSDWLCLTSDGSLYRLDIRRSRAEKLFSWTAFGFELNDETVLCCAPQTDYGAVYQASGQMGFVFDMATGAVKTLLNRGDYRPENSHFPVAFFQAQGRTLLIAATSWNRLDIIDPATCETLTTRSPTSYQGGESRPEHYLDYFHAQLLVSPDNGWVVDNGWVWHPVGIVRAWNLHHWLALNPWESEDGNSLRELASRLNYWDGPICWIDSTTVAVWGWGSDDDWLVSAVRLIDVESGRDLKWFPGPCVRPAEAWPPKKVAPSLFFDKYLFSVSDDIGAAVWDIATGERLHADAPFVPVQYHSRSQEFLTLTTSGFRLSRIVA
ncbi:MAG: hypothetical protein JWN70_1109 [Planctomycetaceae bacterium]|nr:hypothetical protein [Planctomycetaceae bacterium]